jgi:hypothetical protein
MIKMVGADKLSLIEIEGTSDQALDFRAGASDADFLFDAASFA